MEITGVRGSKAKLPSVRGGVVVGGGGCMHRRAGNFLPGGAVNHLPKNISQVAQIFTKESNRNEGHIATT